MERWPTGAHGSTFGGNPVACAAALATLDVLERDGLLRPGRRARRAGASSACGRRPPALDVVTDVRGVGLMIGVELRDKDAAAAVQARCLDDGLLVLTCGPGENVLRLIPPLTITDDELDHGLTILERALADRRLTVLRAISAHAVENPQRVGRFEALVAAVGERHVLVDPELTGAAHDRLDRPLPG